MFGHKTKAGERIVDYDSIDEEMAPAYGDEETIETIVQHAERYVGPVENVFHEVISHLVHIDVHFIPPTEGRDYYTLFTTGMSDLPMTPPEGAEDFKYAELCLNLPKTWRFDDDALNSSRFYWPIELLKILARLPHRYNSWLFYGHSVPNGTPPVPFDRTTKLSGVLLTKSFGQYKDFESLEVSKEKTVHFLNVAPLFRDEIDFKLEHGADATEEKLRTHGMYGASTIKRKCFVPRRWWSFGASKKKIAEEQSHITRHEKRRETHDSTDPQSSMAEQPYELVLLLKEELVVNSYFLHTAYRDVLGLNIPHDVGGDATEFITGDFPFFFVQTGGVTMGINVFPEKYGAKNNHELFPHHNLAMALRHLSTRDSREAKEHEGWIAAFLISDVSDGQDPYSNLGRFLSPFASTWAAVALIEPYSGQTVLVTDTTEQTLIDGQASSLFESGLSR